MIKTTGLLEATDGGLFSLPPLKMPSEYFGEYKNSGGYTKTQPRDWTKDEIKWLIEKKNSGYSIQAIATAMQRSEVSIQIKLKRLTKTSDSYNAKNRQLKYETNQLFLDKIKPEKVLDVFAGNSWWASKVKNCITNDLDTKFETEYHLDALSLLCKLYSERQKFDVIDLDPYGSAYDCFDLAIKMSKKGVVVSFGEWGHKRWKRTDYVEPRYGIASIDDFADGLLFTKEFQRIALCNKKEAKLVTVIQYGNFLRAYFELAPIKITSQWRD